MNEADIVKKLILSLKGQLRGAVIDKHADRIVRNIPDVSVDYGGLTSWIEVKYLRLNETESKRKKHFTKSQLVRCEQRDQQAYCRYFVAYHANNTLCGLLLRPVDVRVALEREPLNILKYASLFGPFNIAVTRLALALKERNVHNLREHQDQEKTNNAGKGKAAVALRRGRHLAFRKVSPVGVASASHRRRATIKASKQSCRRGKR